MRTLGSPFLNILPSLDVHGHTRETVIYPVSSFIDDNIKLKRNKILIIHGIGSGVLSSEIKRKFSKDRRVRKLYITNENVGCTVIELNI